VSRIRLWGVYGVTVAVALIAVWAVGRSSRLAGESAQIVAQAQANAESALRAYRASRDSIPVLRQAFVNAERARQRAQARGDSALVRADRTTADSRRILSADTATVPTLRAALASQVLVTDSLSAAFRAYIVTTEREAQVAAQERAALYGSLAKADTVIAAQARLLNALSKTTQCRVLWLPCPTRTQAFVAGAVLTLGAVVAVTR